MLNNRFVLNSESSDITVKGGFLNRINLPVLDGMVHVGPACIDLVMKENSGIDALEKKLTQQIRRESFLAYLRIQLLNKLGSLLTLVISLIIIILIALLSVHGSLSYDLFSGNESTNILNFRSIYLYLLLSFFILLFLVFSPQIILGSYDNLFDWANKRFSTNSRVVKRLARGLNFLVKRNRELTTVRLWNPMVAGRESWCCRQLIPALMVTDARVEIMIRIDDKEKILQVISDAGLDERFTNQPPDTDETHQGVYPFRLLSTMEKECLHCLVFSSTMNLPQAWKEMGESREVIISREFSERVYHLYESKLSLEGQEGTTFEKFLNRCLFDYGYLRHVADLRIQNLVLQYPDLAGPGNHSLQEGMADTVKNNIGSLSANVSDPLALVILIGLVCSDKDLNNRKIDLVQEFIRNVKRTENYWLINHYWRFISLEKEKSDGDFKLGLLQFMDVQTLKDLSVCFANAGMYANAMEVYGILENIYPAKIAIDIADLKDSLGEYMESLEILLKADETWVKSGMIEDRALILELYLNIAWVIVSGRFDEHQKQGYDYLAKTDEILQKIPNTEDYIMFVTRYFNTKANYHEWEGNYELAIENYEKALKLPGTILRKSSLLSNRGIAERFLGKAAEELPVKRKHFITSCSNIQKALNMKKGIGEKNQIPGTSHNLTETLLELSRVVDDKKEKIGVLKEADKVTSEALNILAELKSQKRKGRLLTERYIAHHLLGELGETSETDQIRPLLKEWFLTEEKNSHDYRETTKLLKRFGIES